MDEAAGADGIRLAAAARTTLALDDAGRPVAPVRLAEPAIAREVAHRLAIARPGNRVLAGEVLALGLLDEVNRVVVERYLTEVDRAAFAAGAARVRSELGDEATDATFSAYGATFPPPDGHDEPTSRELLLTWLAAANPALGDLRVLVDDRPLSWAHGARYGDAVATLARYFADARPIGPSGEDLVTLLRAPAVAVPGSLVGQLAYVRDHWGSIIGGRGRGLLDRLSVGLGVIAEEAAGLGRRPGPAGPGGGLGALHLGLGGSRGDGLEPDPEPERFSHDLAWMPELVLMAKSTHVWLDQLSRRYAREVRSLAAIPDEELDRLARRGVTGLWLIGLWERSRASREIKRRRGNPDALASAYALDDYVIASDLGGPAALDELRGRAGARGIRLASDMVPNHMGIDSRWVVEHPDWFLSLPRPPFPAYTFGGPDLSSDERVAIVLEDHYWNDADAAVVFKRADRWTGDERYVYHGNDGTSFPWNDTAQLDFIRADVREAVIQTILHVARQFPVIRFDAAMVLAKRHIERLWHPLPGSGGAIPSRAEHAMTKREFDAAMPVEFWREVVDRVAAEAPGTLLLAEAFWLMEGYFVRTLGMHRVYNSAFMNLLRDEDNATYRRVMRETLEFDPQILGRFVNFMSNPDEKTAVEQFGTGDKHFGVATLMATLPGLPMLGHGQFEGFRERYGMEFSRAAWDEPVDEGLEARYDREIVPILHRRAWFAGSRDFLLYDVVGDDGGVREDVYAYSNIGPAGERSLVVYHNRFARTAGRVLLSVAYSAADPATGERSLRRRTLADGLDLWRGDPDDLRLGVAYVRARELRSGLEFLWPARDIVRDGLLIEAEAYDYRVYIGWTTVVDDLDGRWGRLAATLAGRGTSSLDDALRDLELAHLHDALAATLAHVETAPALVAATRAATATRGGASDGEVVAAIRSASRAADEVFGGSSPARRSFRAAAALADPATAAALRIHAIVEPLGSLGASPDTWATSRAWFGELRLGPALERALGVLGKGGSAVAGAPAVDAGAAVHRAWLLLALGRAVGGPGRPVGGPGGPASGGRALTGPGAAGRLAAWLDDEDLAAALGVHAWDGHLWLTAEGVELVGGLAVALAATTERRQTTAAERAVVAIDAAAAASGYRIDLVRDALALSDRPTTRGAQRPAVSRTSAGGGSAAAGIRARSRTRDTRGS
ncbi:MAG: alpha-amylase family glycosyl hydrolase [Candidatus Limnocylindrales bacterium]